MSNVETLIDDAIGKPSLLGLFKNIVKCVSDPPKAMHFWRITTFLEVLSKILKKYMMTALPMWI